MIHCVRGIHRSGSTAVMVLIIILLAWGKTYDFKVAAAAGLKLFVEKRGLMHRRHEVEKAFFEFVPCCFMPELARRLALEFQPKSMLIPPPLQSQESPLSTATSSTATWFQQSAPKSTTAKPMRQLAPAPRGSAALEK